MEGDFLDDIADAPQNLNDTARAWAAKAEELFRRYAEAEAAYTRAKNEYEVFVRAQLPQAMHSMGLSTFDTNDYHVTVRLVTHVSVPKDRKQEVCEWVREREPSLLKEELVVPAEMVEALRRADIPFDRKMDVNTNRLKAYLLDALGQKGGVAVMSQSDLPDGIKFFQYEEAQMSPRTSV